jgi:hypothetical protein
MTRWHPWRAIRRHREINVEWVDLPDGTLGDSLGHSMRLTTGLLQTERRAVATHEYLHICRGDLGDCASNWHESKQEREVCRLTAELCITLDDLVDALLWSKDEHEVADCLWVPVEVLQDRLAHLTDSENAYITRRLLLAEGEMTEEWHGT